MKILTATQIRTAERDAVQSGIFSCFSSLMEKAAKTTFEYIINNFDVVAKKICVVCGCGNNGGDGIVVANLLKSKGAFVTLVFPMGKPTSSPADEFLYLADDITIVNDIPSSCDILIDALFGIGLNRELDGDILETVNKMNDTNALKIAIDIPSGVNADGKFSYNAFCADFTLTFIALKPCFVLPCTLDYCGKVILLDIGVKTTEYAYQTTEMPLKPKRKINTHKGTYGTALMVTGSYGMCGASVLSAKAALVSGVGMVKSFVCDKNYSAFTVSVPEAVAIPVLTTQSGAMDVYEKQLVSALSSSNAMLIGCGLGKSEEAVKLVFRALQITTIPTVIDADGINALSRDIQLLKKIKVPTVITPHPKEMARLCETNVSNIEANRPEYAKRVATRFNTVVVLKGARTVIASPDGKVYFNMTGNSGMATGGSGDVLAGMITARLCLGESTLEASLNAVWLHGYAGDKALSQYSMEGLLPTDIIAELKTL